MIKCPKCGAQIDDNARFCMYCMTSLDNKKSVDGNGSNKSVHIVVISVILAVLVLLISLCFAFCGKGDKNDYGNFESFPAINSDFEDSLSSEESDKTSPDDSGSNTETSSKPSQGGTTTSESNTSGSSSDGGSSKPSSKEQGSSSKMSSKASSSSTKPSSTSSPTSSDNGSSSNTSSNTSAAGYPAATAAYAYRDATSADDEFFVNSAKLLGGVIITGVTEKAPNGVYVIPEYLGGKKVVAVAKNAFTSNEIKDTVKVVVFPKTMLTVNAYSFSSCYYITDIYFASENVYIAGDAFPREDKRNTIITLHSSNTAENRNLTRLENFAIMYQGMLFSTWNGGAID